jgi:CRP/FNR family nitrogen fixation transcriptional regulator
MLRRNILAFRRGPIRYRRNKIIACEGDPADYVFLVVSGVVRSCRTFRSGERSIIAFHMPGELFGWTGDATHPLSTEAATDAVILFLKRSALLASAVHNTSIANFLLANTASELRRVQEHSVLIGRDAKCRMATFLTDLATRTGQWSHIDLPMAHQDIADYLGLSIETVSRTITGLEHTGLIARASPRTLVLKDRASLALAMN